MGAKLKIAFFVILAGVFFFPPDGADAQKSLRCECGTKIGPEARAGADDFECHKEGDKMVQNCTGGFCFKTYREQKGSETALNQAARGCVATPLWMGCKEDTTVKSAPNVASDSKTKMITCFCNNTNFCNSVGQLRGMSLTQLSMSAIFVGVIVSRIGGIQ